jgi:hypothetical protein
LPNSFKGPLTTDSYTSLLNPSLLKEVDKEGAPLGVATFPPFKGLFWFILVRSPCFNADESPSGLDTGNDLLKVKRAGFFENLIAE